MRVNIDDTDFDDGLRYFYKGEPLTGEAVETDPDGNMIEITTFRNGVEEGRSWHGTRTAHANTRACCRMGIPSAWCASGTATASSRKSESSIRTAECRRSGSGMRTDL